MSKQITMYGNKFDVSEPYEEGHTITALEARVLNQTRAENVSNAMRKGCKAAVEAGKLDEFRQTFAAYEKEYKFTAGGSGTGTRTMDPVEREARKLARQAIRNKLAADGRKVSEVAKEDMAAAVEQVAAMPEIQKLAKKRVAEEQKAVSEALGNLNLDQ